MKQGDVYLSTPSPITDERELRVVVSSDAYNTRPGCVSVLVAEIETGTRLRPTQHGILTDYGFEGSPPGRRCQVSVGSRIVRSLK